MTGLETQNLAMEGLIHDLNNVFQTIGESAELLRSDVKWRKVASTLQRCAVHGQRLANSILDGQRASIDPLTVVESAMQFARDYLECVHAPELLFHHDIDLQFRFPGDSAAWERVLVNLFLNAAEAGAKRVRVSAHTSQLMVRDDGRGIPEELLPHIFQPRVSSKTILSGLGLYVVQSIVEQHGGVVSAVNLPEGGAGFCVVLPGLS